MADRTCDICGASATIWMWGDGDDSDIFYCEPCRDDYCSVVGCEEEGHY